LEKSFFLNSVNIRDGSLWKRKQSIDEVFRETGITLDEAMHFKMEEVNRPDDMRDNFERCSKELEELYWRDSSVYDLTVNALQLLGQHTKKKTLSNALADK
jgi:hypothetical protein